MGGGGSGRLGRRGLLVLGKVGVTEQDLQATGLWRGVGGVVRQRRWVRVSQGVVGGWWRGCPVWLIDGKGVRVVVSSKI